MQKALIVDNQTDTLPELEAYIASLGYEYDVIGFDSLDTAEGYDLTVLSGGPWFSDEAANAVTYRKEMNFIRETKTPVIGICLGMLLIAQAYGGSVIVGPRRNGLAVITPVGDDTKSTVFENHTVRMIQPPDELEVLATSDACIEAIRHKTKPLYGVQFHPEIIDPQNNGARYLSRLIGY